MILRKNMECLEKWFSKKNWKRVALFVVTFGSGFPVLCLVVPLR